MTMNAEVRDNPEQQRFEMPLDDGEMAVALYRIRDGKMFIVHSEVPRQFSGKGLGTKLMEGVCQRLRESNRKAVPVCSFVARYFSEHPECADVLAD